MRVAFYLTLVALLATVVTASFIARLKSIYLLVALDLDYGEKSEERIEASSRYRHEGGLFRANAGAGRERQGLRRDCDARNLVAEACGGNGTSVGVDVCGLPRLAILTCALRAPMSFSKNVSPALFHHLRLTK